MAVEEGALPVGTTEEVLDTVVVEQEDGTDAHREMVSVGDPETTEARARVSSTEENATRYALQVQDDKMDDLISMMGVVVEQLKIMNLHLYAMTDETFDPQDTEQ